MAQVNLSAMKPADAIKYFERKGYHFGFDWYDTDPEQHSRSFTVAKVMELDILADIREALDRALANGTTLKTFRDELEPLLISKGWWGKKTVIDPKTNKPRIVQLGSPRRLEIIFDTNMRTAHSAGRWQRIKRQAQILAERGETVYLRYVAVRDERTRLLHKSWNGIILPWDHPFWDTHYPPNGWRCRCIVQIVTQRDLDRNDWEVSPDPKPMQRPWYNRKTGKTRFMPEGIDPGWDHNVGKLSRQFDDNQLQDLPVLEGVPDWKSLGRPDSRTIQERPSPPKRWLTLKEWIARGNSPDVARKEIKTAYRKLVGIKADAFEAHIPDYEGMEVLFNTGLLNYVVNKGQGREAFLPFAKATIEDPFEVWLVPFRKADGRVVMRKRYIGLFKDERNREYQVTVERFRDGWGIWNVFPDRTINSKRKGYLLYSK